jgi:hypothetical protein
MLVVPPLTQEDFKIFAGLVVFIYLSPPEQEPEFLRLLMVELFKYQPIFAILLHLHQLIIMFKLGKDGMELVIMLFYTS